ncbi:3-isopropylmalate dehydrogenase [Wenzhouxiangella sp. AB-CW3]|uniref:3-isopropylmalate dehydrogenase n=1 Tax=Wenzhouxiangella sp. AB-CW3 TaxID=2771012 RepID=UPI00168AE39A|nr:3-isopropylmalate dehydrogenase [Wenzhouxiangella sp. AB-CW3]QOC22065.1 3-isopropylmalate dehydrogenase [Wenzhouxiangella sp. AB-CW3]
MRATITLLPGDGIGPEITTEAETLLNELAEQHGHDFELHRRPIGGAAIDALGVPLPSNTLAACHQSDAVLLGAVGGPKWDDPEARIRPEQGLLQLRQELGLYANLRPVKPHPALFDASPLRSERLENVDLVVVRELTGGLYFGRKVEFRDMAEDVCRYERGEIERVVRRAAALARTRRGRLTLVDKANVLATSRLWRSVTRELVRREFPDIELEIILVDAAAMHLLSRPADFDVIVTENLFGDILTDEAAMLAGSMGLLPSASLGDKAPGLYEPIHGSAPDLAGCDRANPFAMFLSVAMMLEQSLGLIDEARQVEAAVHACIDAGQTTPDLGGSLGTRAAGAAVRQRLAESHQSASTEAAVRQPDPAPHTSALATARAS